MASSSRHLPSWAHWSHCAAAQPWTVGVQEEVLLADRDDWSPANSVAELRRRLAAHLSPRVTAGTHACVAVLATGPHAGAPALATELAELRRELAGAAQRMGPVAPAGAGMHPCALWSEASLSPGPRSRLIYTSMRELARREPTCALHVHVAVPDSPAALRAFEGLRADVPLLLAVAANSPFWQSRDTGFASARTPIMAMFPRVGLPRSFATYTAYVETVEALLRSGAVPDPTFLWWDIRLRPQLGTVELRVMDSQTRSSDAAALAALVQCRVRLHAEGRPRRVAPVPEALHENRFLAARDGMRARLIDPASGTLRCAHALLAEMLSECAPVAEELGCGAQLDDVARLAGDPGYADQREIATLHGVDAVLPALSHEFAPDTAVLVRTPLLDAAATTHD